MGDSDSGDVFDLYRLRRIVDLMQECDLSEVDLQNDDQKIKLRRGAVAPMQPVAPVQAAAAAPASAPAAADDPNIQLIKSPMVGTFYAKANPETPSFVKVGDNVDAETTVCIIEAMKVFNEIVAEVNGKVVAVLINNEDPVEFGTPLFKIDTSQ
jgi:acetyl-CoA carboxylase biotin carboxyl carrier protein